MRGNVRVAMTFELCQLKCVFEHVRTAEPDEPAHVCSLIRDLVVAYTIIKLCRLSSDRIDCLEAQDSLQMHILCIV